jgi:hypothetical protein
MIRELAAFEPIFHAPEFGLIRADFEVHTAGDVWQVGASGSVCCREDVWTALEQRYANPTPDEWYASESCCRAVGGRTYLLTYLLRQGPRTTRRLTVWERAAGRWRIVSHQRTIPSGPAAQRRAAT